MIPIPLIHTGSTKQKPIIWQPTEKKKYKLEAKQKPTIMLQMSEIRTFFMGLQKTTANGSEPVQTKEKNIV